MTDIKLGDLEPLVQKAILDSLNDDVRTKLISDAIATLITPKKDNYSNKMLSPLQEMFDRALYSAANTVVVQIIAESPEYQGKIREVVSGFLGNLDEDMYDSKTMEVVVGALVNHFQEAKREARSY